MRQKMKNTVRVNSSGADLETLKNIEVYMTQGNLFFQYIPTVVSSSEMTFDVPFEDAMKLKQSKVRLQFAFQHPDGTPDASDITECSVNELLKGDGYDPS